MAEIKDILVNKFTEFEKELNGQTGTPVHDARKLAIKSFGETGLPGPKDEEYKYTHLGRVLTKHIDISGLAQESKLSKEKIESFRFAHEDANVLFFVNGFFQKDLSTIISPESELIILELKEAFKKFPEEINENFGKHLNLKDAFAAINTAFSQQGIFIKINKGKVVSHPVIIYNITDSEVETPVYHPKNIVLAEENSQAHLIETYQTSGDKACFVNHTSEIVVKRAANLAYYKIQEESENTIRVDNSQINQSKDSVFNAFTFTFSGKVVRNNLTIGLNDPHCESHMYGLYLVNGSTHVDNHTTVDHKEPNSFSNEVYKGILDGSSTGVFNGKIYVRQDAQKTNAFQSNKNILLTDTATINTKPQLEIWADDVQCSHGCTTGQLDEEQMFYLRTRGISRENARALLLKAFASDVLENISIEFLNEHLQSIIDRRLSFK